MDNVNGKHPIQQHESIPHQNNNCAAITISLKSLYTTDISPTHTHVVPAVGMAMLLVR
jgi:hypothetical protein